MVGTFAAGAALYPLIELGWRGRSHPAMALAGGLSLCAMRRLHRAMKNRPLWQPSLLGGLTVTGMEYAFGVLFNRRYQIWDYRRAPLNLHGQICLPYLLGWCALSAAAIQCMRVFTAPGPECPQCGGWPGHRRKG